MILLVCGGREYADHEHAWAALDAIHLERPIALLIQGGASGADRLAFAWAMAKGLPCATYHAAWGTHGRAAGPRRNADMLRFGRPDLVVAFPGGKGTANMIALSKADGVEVRRA